MSRLWWKVRLYWACVSKATVTISHDIGFWHDAALAELECLESDAFDMEPAEYLEEQIEYWTE